MKRWHVLNLVLIVVCVVVSVHLLRPLNLRFHVGVLLALPIGAAIGLLVALANRHVWGRWLDHR